MKKLQFCKMVASGNDFVVARLKGEQTFKLKKIASMLCNRKYGIGSDGLLIVGPSKKADASMRVFNADGSEAEMCGNGARCVSLYLHSICRLSTALSIETKAGVISAQISGGNVKIKLTDPSGYILSEPLALRKTLHVGFVNTGVPHVVIFVEGLEAIDVENIGRQIRYHKRFAPRGTNVNFVEILSRTAINIRTYERGVEGETLACGTGSVASALIFALRTGATHKVHVHTKGKEVLTVYFKRVTNSFSDVWLEGNAKIVFSGTCVI